MKPTHHTLDTNTGKLGYLKFAGGRKTLICFHGFGQHAEVFRPMAEAVHEEYSLLAVDLYYFGQSERNEQRPLTTMEWGSTFGQLCEQEAIEQFHVLGYSLGGKFALASMMAFPEKCQSLHLLAPDGIRSSFWYELATFPGVSRYIFKPLCFHPNAIPKLIYAMGKIGMLNSKMLKFGMNMTATANQRQQLYNVWTTCKAMRHPRSKIVATINQSAIPLHLYVGKYDLIMKPDGYDGFLSKIKTSQKHVLDCGHNHLINKCIPLVNIGNGG